MTAPLQSLLLHGEAGAFEMPPSSGHVLVVHASGTIGQSFACDGPMVRRELRRGDADLIPAGASLRLADEGASRVLAVVLPADWAAAALDALGLGATALRPQFSQRDTALHDVAWRIQRRRQAGRSGLYDEALATELIRNLHRVQTGQPGPQYRAQPLPRPALRRVLDYIESHLDQPITIQELALEAGVGTTAFKAAFRLAVGAPAHRYVVVRRAERARLLLLAGEAPASQVALEAGFSHQTHMARWLRRLFGALPSEIARAAD